MHLSDNERRSVLHNMEMLLGRIDLPVNKVTIIKNALFDVLRSTTKNRIIDLADTRVVDARDNTFVHCPIGVLPNNMTTQDCRAICSTTCAWFRIINGVAKCEDKQIGIMKEGQE